MTHTFHCSINISSLSLSLAGYPFALVYRKFFYYQSATVIHLFHAFSGLALAAFNFGETTGDSIHGIHSSKNKHNYSFLDVWLLLLAHSHSLSLLHFCRAIFKAARMTFSSEHTKVTFQFRYATFWDDQMKNAHWLFCQWERVRLASTYRSNDRMSRVLFRHPKPLLRFFN